MTRGKALDMAEYHIDTALSSYRSYIHTHTRSGVGLRHVSSRRTSACSYNYSIVAPRGAWEEILRARNTAAMHMPDTKNPGGNR